MIAEIIAAISAAGRYVIGRDGFNRVNGPLGNAEIGGAWSVNNGTVTIVSFKAKGGTSGTTNMATLLMPQLDYEISADFTWATGEVLSVIARSDSSAAQNFMRLRYDGTKIEIMKTISGTSTSLASYNHSWANGATKNLKLFCRGNTFTGYINDVAVISVTDDNATKTLTRAGIGLYKSGGVPASTAKNVLVNG